jgi:Rrf2 family protein
MAFYSSGVEYGIHSLMCMVDAKGTEREMSVREMAELQGVPYDYLGKVFTRLSRAGLVISTEGKGGGFKLARPAELITVLDVAHAIGDDLSAGRGGGSAVLRALAVGAGDGD